MDCTNCGLDYNDHCYECEACNPDTDCVCEVEDLL